MKKHFILVLLITLASVFNALAQTQVWKLDKSHSSIGFAIDHMVISETKGEFDDFTLNVLADKPDFTDAKFDVNIPVQSINTKDKKRDEHLVGPDFFDAAKYPNIVIKGVQFKKVSGKKYKAIVDFAMHGITKRVQLDAVFNGIVKDPWGNTRAGLLISGEIDRYLFDLKYNSALEAGGVALGQMVRISCSFELIKG
ncbi:MAG: polyisoprenoid-binding protein [Cytophagales bacterium]|nr:MAG: polyisoprenoid-binding protein [Cytophagales bacterium]TAF61083.1 MAG: polyisoprenoid-binding protein [Cytophagales bacterium]